ncbi:MAG: ASKHA domain-containing protein [Bacillota bacterium]|nr:ASKHA domain-containing protein [Bacillota bacterium]
MTRLKCAGCRKTSCNGCSLYEHINTGKNQASLFPADFVPDQGKGLGMAFDMGTTTIAGSLWDLKKCTRLETHTCVNPGRYAGSDVISRLTRISESAQEKKKMQRILVEKLDEMARSASAEYEGEIARVTVAGNTVMCEMLLGESLEGLLRAPFHKDYEGTRRLRGKELGFSYLKDAMIIVLPAIEGYVGADALAVHTYVKHSDGRTHVLAVDIGTNGEILLFGRNETYACSAAAGPALEGAAVVQGMGAADGAICEVSLGGRFPREDIFCKVIGGGAPKGICGSGLVDAFALLKRLKVIDPTGYLYTVAEARKAGAREQFCRRIMESEKGNSFLLTDKDNPVFLTSEDIRQLQLAKGAIRAGIEILLSREQIKGEELAHIYVAGSFGSFIRKESAVEIGLLPDVTPDKITHVGNCAGTGASMALLSEKVLQEMEQDANKIRHVELAMEERFQACFLDSLRV